LADFELSEHEVTLLLEACRVADVCADLQGRVDREGTMTRTRLGEDRANPALVELRQQRILLTRLIVALRVPVGDQDDSVGAAGGAGDRPQYRGPRGVYAVGGS
jgi:hypothetical protein